MNHKLSAILSFLAMNGVFLSGPASADFVAGLSSNGNVTIGSSANWTTVRSVLVTIPSTNLSTYSCVANASADVDHNGTVGVEQKYRFTIERNNSNPTTDGGSERTVETIDNTGVDDPDTHVVATTRHFTGLTRTNGTNGTGQHTFYFLGRIQQGTSTEVLDASFNVICVPQ
jgi:hypothetical protein